MENYSQYKQTAGRSTVPLAMRLRQAPLRMTILYQWNIEGFLYRSIIEGICVSIVY